MPKTPQDLADQIEGVLKELHPDPDDIVDRMTRARLEGYIAGLRAPRVTDI